MSMLPWDQLLAVWAFRDLRLRARALLLLEAIEDRPGQAFSSVFKKEKKNAKAAYEFCENDAVDFDLLLTPTFIATGQLIREQTTDVILAIQDTTEIDLSSLKSMEGLGEIGNPKCRGIFLHSALAVTPDGVPVGLVAARTWVRSPLEHGKSVARRARIFEEKESAKWWNTIEAAERAIGSLGRLVHVGDRESDVFDVIARTLASGFRGLFRAAQDRKTVDAEHQRLWSEAESWPVQGQRTIEIPARLAKPGQTPRAARTAELAIRFGQVTLAQPRSPEGFVTVSAILLREVDPPSSEDVIEWMLLSTDQVTTAKEAWRRVDWYRRRWLIEEFHKCLKTTCRIEERQFKDRPHYENFLALNMLVSMRILFVRNVARVEPDAPAQAILSPEEELVLRAYHDEGSRKKQPAFITASLAVRLVAILGGFPDRKGDGDPGFQTLAKGFTELAAMCAGFRLAARLFTRNQPPPSPLDPALLAYFRARSHRLPH